MTELVRNESYGFYVPFFPYRWQRWLVLDGGTSAGHVRAAGLTKSGALRKWRRIQAADNPRRETIS